MIPLHFSVVRNMQLNCSFQLPWGFISGFSFNPIWQLPFACWNIQYYLLEQKTCVCKALYVMLCGFISVVCCFSWLLFPFIKTLLFVCVGNIQWLHSARVVSTHTHWVLIIFTLLPVAALLSSLLPRFPSRLCRIYLLVS